MVFQWPSLQHQTGKAEVFPLLNPKPMAVLILLLKTQDVTTFILQTRLLLMLCLPECMDYIQTNRTKASPVHYH